MRAENLVHVMRPGGIHRSGSRCGFAFGRGTGRDRPVGVAVSTAQRSPVTGESGADCGGSRTDAGSAWRPAAVGDRPPLRVSGAASCACACADSPSTRPARSCPACQARNAGARRYRPRHAARHHARAGSFHAATGHRRRQLRPGRRVRAAAGGAARHVGSRGHGAPRDGPRPGRQRLPDGRVLLAGRRTARRVRDRRMQLPGRVQLQACRRAGPVGPGTRVTGVGPPGEPAAGLESVPGLAA